MLKGKMIDFIWIKAAQNALVFVFSLIAFCFSIKFYNDTENVFLPAAPKATQDL